MTGQELRLNITHSQRTNVLAIFGHCNDCGLPNLSRIRTPCSNSLHNPHVAIRYHLGILLAPKGEIWNCDMTSTADGFFINNGEYFIKVRISPHGLIFTEDHNFHFFHGCTGVVTLLLPSSRPQKFKHIVQLYSVDGFHSTCVSCLDLEISVPGPRLDEYQEGPEIEKPIRKIRPRGMWASRSGMTVIKRFQRLADDGKRDLFVEEMGRLDKLADSRPMFIDLMPLVLYELAMLDLHENRTDMAEQNAKKALEISRTYHSTNHCYLLAKLKYVKSAIARRKGDYAKAKELLDHSVELLLPCAAGEETAENRYFVASYYVEKSAKVGISDQEEAIAENHFQDVEQHLSADTRPITNRFQIRSKNRQLAFYVKSSRHVKNLDFQRLVPEQHMAKAFQLIKEIEESLLEFYPKKPLLSFDIVKTDYYIRRGNFEQGIAPSTEALMIAREKRWPEYEVVATKRLQLCCGRRGRKLRETSV